MKAYSYLLAWGSLCLMLVGVSGCGSASLDEHKGTQPELKLEQFFTGKLKAYGMVFDRSGNLLRRFNADLIGHWEGDTGELKEWFEFDDGEKSTRVWQLTKTADNQYQGQAADVVGIAKGQTQGSALYWQYDLLVEVEGETYQLTLDDWMFLLDEKRLFNKTEMTKFGFKVGEIVLYIEKLDD
ncbi:DUF3833 domain-containing protein [Shewanella sp. Isolate11]|uniref:DUF3833 domain-containing protein n=1 Tax=Shewanella sp. Isolate11 TaxID=2908530 RepID=UPI001EFC9D68|nr:DUF3833 domain-containing protein [Shewanella sp. Isolate11]MCG9697076.1 DUF3833 domain-containing protein [Shewanella sp. Isolate11]